MGDTTKDLRDSLIFAAALAFLGLLLAFGDRMTGSLELGREARLLGSLTGAKSLEAAPLALVSPRGGARGLFVLRGAKTGAFAALLPYSEAGRSGFVAATFARDGSLLGLVEAPTATGFKSLDAGELKLLLDYAAAGSGGSGVLDPRVSLDPALAALAAGLADISRRIASASEVQR